MFWRPIQPHATESRVSQVGNRLVGQVTVIDTYMAVTGASGKKYIREFGTVLL